MAPKNKKRTGFYFFMKELQEIEAAKGRRITLSTMPNHAHPIWKTMSVAEKEPYEEMARLHKNDPSLRGGKLASDGTRVEDNLAQEEEIKRQENRMIQNIKRFCNTDCESKEQFIEIVSRKVIYFMSFNVLCVTDEDVFIPIEVGIVEYSIQRGIHRQYDKILYPGPPPTGYAGIAKQLSEEKHQINIFGEEDNCERNMRKAFEDIKNFVTPTNKDEFPPIFCERSDIQTTVGCLDWLAKVSREENMFEVWDSSYLLMELRAGVGSPLPSYAIASDLLSKASFNYHPSTRCEFHEEKDMHFCALSYSKRLCYLLSDAICELFNVTLTEKHIPTRAVEEKAYTVTVIKDSPRLSDVNPVRLDKNYSYYQNVGQAEEKTKPKAPVVPRQPASSCMAEEMNRLRLNMSAATVPGHGIGRGIRKN